MKHLRFLVGMSIFLAICIGLVSWKTREKQENRSKAVEEVKEVATKLGSRGDIQTPDPVFFDQIMNRREKVAIIVYSTTYQQIRGELDEYVRLVNEKFADKLEGPLMVYTDSLWNSRNYRGYCAGDSETTEAFRIRKLLKDISQRDRITGAILVGKIPSIRWFQKRASINRTYGPHLL